MPIKLSILLSLALLAGCSNDAEVASRNLSFRGDAGELLSGGE